MKRGFLAVGSWFSGNFLPFKRLTLKVWQGIMVMTITFSSLLIAFQAGQVFAACPGSPPSCVHMLLFWDGTDSSGGALSVPTGWTEVSSTYNNLFPRGDTPANFGVTGGTTNHIPTTSSVTTSANDNTAGTNGAGTGEATSGHTHPPATVTITDNSPSSNNNLPAYRTLRLISCDSGIPNTIPNGAIALFDNTPGIPGSGWTRISAQDGEMIRINTTAGLTGGQDTHSYTYTWSGLGASSGSIKPQPLLAFGNTGAVDGHTHAAPAPTTSPAMSSLPAYVQPLLAKANSSTPTISVGFSAMFDGDPGGGWVVRTQSSGTGDPVTYYHQYLRPNSSWNGTSQGSDSETLPTATATTGPPSATTASIAGLGIGNGSSGTHTHTLTANFNTSTDMDPPYFGVVIAEKVDFILSDYGWYEDTTTADPAANPGGRWSTLDLAQDTAIPPLPRAYNQPDANAATQLRLQLLIKVNGNNLNANVAQFKLQYKQGATDQNCTTGTWTDVDTGGTGTGAWRYGTSSIADGTPLTSARLGGNILQEYVKSASSPTNPNAVTIGQTMEYDFHIQDNAAIGGTHYNFRILESIGTLLSEYDVCPTLSTLPSTGEQMRHGLFFEDGSAQGFSWAN